MRIKKLVKRIRNNRIQGIDSLLIDGGGESSEPADYILTAAGAQGQWIFAIPRYDMVVVVIASADDFAIPVDFLYSDILQAVISQ